MALGYVDYFNGLVNLLETNKSLQTAIKFKDAGGKVGLGAVGIMTAAVLGGPVGAVLGGLSVLGSTLSVARSRDYKSLIKILNHLTSEERSKLVREVQDVVGSASISGLNSFISQQSHQSALVQLLQSSIQNKK